MNPIADSAPPREVLSTTAGGAPIALREPLTAQDILANVRALRPVVREEADRSEAQGFMTTRMTEAFRAAGVYRAGFARRRGGPEMSLTDQTRMVEAVATVDAGIAWNVTVLAATGFYAGRLTDAAFAELYPSLDLPTCGSFHPKGRAVEVPGGYLVTGSWKFGSGIRSADRIVAGVEVERDGEPVRKPDGTVLTLGVWLPVDAVTLVDDWHAVGLRSSGSQGYAVTDVFVPAAHSFDRFHAPTGSVDPLNKHVDLPFYSMAGISVGIAQHAVDLAVEHLRDRKATERQFALLGEADCYVRAARHLVLQGVGAIDDEIFADGGLPDERVLARGDAPLATEFARTVLDRCGEILGSRTVYNACPFERLLRDLAGVSAHASTWRSRWVDVGATLVRCALEDRAADL